MKFWKYCPVCQTRRILRKEVQTCGTKSCVRTWRTFSLDQRAFAEEKAQEKHDQLIEAMMSLETGGADHLDPADGNFPEIPLSKEAVDDLFHNATNPSPSARPFNPPLQKTVQRDNEFLKKVFGEDAPGVVEPEDKDKEDKKDD